MKIKSNYTLCKLEDRYHTELKMLAMKHGVTLQYVINIIVSNAIKTGTEEIVSMIKERMNKNDSSL